MNPDDQVVLDFYPLFRQYASGRVERLTGMEEVPPSTDPNTGVTSKDVVIDATAGLQARLFLPNLRTSTPSPPSRNLPILLYFHGGFFCINTAFSPAYLTYLNTLCSRAGLLAVSVNYRLAPENLLPVAYGDAATALNWALSASDPWIAQHGDCNRVILSGDSAGGNICHNLAMEKTLGIEFESMVLAQPYFWGSKPIEGESAPPQLREWVESLWAALTSPEIKGVDDPRFNPIAEGAPSLAGLRCRRAMVCVAELDFLRARGVAYYKALEQSGWGGAGEFLESKGVDHIFHITDPNSDEAQKMMDRVVAFLRGEI